MTYLNEKKIVQLNPSNLRARTYSIQESVVVGHAEKVKKYTSGKVRFNTILQTCGDTNQNKRMYPKNVMVDAIKRVEQTIKNRNLVGELDHPISTNQTRQTAVLYKECSHVITNLEMRGDEVWGEVETLPYTPNGKIMSGLVLDRVAIGFSLRGLADLEDNGSYQRVLPPLIIVTWDCVQNPSHKKASIQEVYQEQLVKVVNESRNLIETNSGKCYLPNLFDELVERKIINLYQKWW